MKTYYFIIRDERGNSTLVLMESEKKEDAHRYLSEFYKTYEVEFVF